MLVNRLERNKEQAASVFQLFVTLLGLFLVVSSLTEVPIFIPNSLTLLQLATIRCIAVSTTSIFSSEMNHYWFKRTANLRYKTTDFLMHAIQKAFDDVSVVTSKIKTANA